MVQDKGRLVHPHPANELTEKLFGIESVINKAKVTDADATTFFLNSDAVPSGKIWKITYISAYNADGDVATRFQINIIHNGDTVVIKQKVTATSQGETVEVSGEFYLDAGDYVQAAFVGVAVDETCRLHIFGYEMNAP